MTHPQLDFGPIVHRMALLISRAGCDLENTPAMVRLMNRADITDGRALAHLPDAIRLARSWRDRSPVNRSFDRR